jgi:hypothetical protein
LRTSLATVEVATKAVIADPESIDEISFEQSAEGIPQGDVRESPSLEIDDADGFISDVIEDYAIDFICTDWRDVGTSKKIGIGTV